jgi:hypothetical protein
MWALKRGSEAAQEKSLNQAKFWLGLVFCCPKLRFKDNREFCVLAKALKVGQEPTMGTPETKKLLIPKQVFKNVRSNSNQVAVSIDARGWIEAVITKGMRTFWLMIGSVALFYRVFRFCVIYVKSGVAELFDVRGGRF